MALDMLKRSLQLLGGSTVATGRNYFSNVASLVDDSKRIGSEMKDTISKPFEFIRKMTTSGSVGGGLYKYVNDWFYQRTSEFDSDDDDFDSGMGSTDVASGTSEKPSTELDSKAMKSIAHEQIGAMYQIGQKQVQAGLANTSEIVTTFNNRSTEIITSINNLNKSVMNIDKNLARLVAYGEAESERYNRENDTKNIFDGNPLSLGRVFEAAKTGASENTTWIMAKGYLDALKEGPSVITDTIMNNLIGNIKIGGKTLQEQAEGINEKIGSGIESFLLGVLKNDWFKKIFGNMGSFNTDLSAHIKYDYNKEKAVFDGMTRRTIIEIIPEYLKKITNALTGETWNIDPKKGKLTQNNVNLASIEMSKAMSENLFGNSALYASNDAKAVGKELAEFSKVPSGVSAQILEWLSAGYIMAMGEKGRSASSYNNENGLMQDTGALLETEKGDEVGTRAIDIAWGIWQEKYGDGDVLGINGKSGFVRYCKLLISKIVFAKGSLTADNFKKAIHRALQSAKSTGINLAQQGYDPHFHDITAMSKFIAENSINYKETSSEVEKKISERLEEINKRINTPEGKFNQQEAADVLQQYFGKSIDDFKDEKKKGFLSSNVEEVKRFIEKTIREQETEKALEQDISSRIDTSGSFYAKGNKHQNIGSLVYDIKKLLEDGITVRVDKRGTRGSGGIPSKLNLNTHGCGPVALTDLANRMAMYGAYDPYYGTSVGDYISTAQSLGMNLQPGRATRRALMSASPINPITVLGSGYGFGTETGQNHYMNIVGYNDGYVYTSNPMYGGGRYPVGAIANNSILGLFGRGTSDDIKAGINKAVDDLDQRISDIDPDSPTGKLVDLMHSVLDVRDAKSYVGNPDKKKRRSVREKLDSAVDTGEEKYHSAKAKFTGIKDAIGGYFGAKKQAISDDTKEMLDVAIDNTRRRAQAIVKSEDYRKSTVSKMDSGGYSDKDKSLANQALSMMQTAVQDGDGASDLNAIKKVINKINNRELRSDLETNITTLINQSAKKTAQPKSKIGKFILFGFGLVKKLFSPVFKVGKVLLSTIGKAISGTWHAIKTYGPKILYWLAKPYVKGMARIKSGFKSIGRGIFGEKVKLQDGTVVRQRPTGHIFSNFSRTFKESKDMANEKLAKLDTNNPNKKKAIAEGDVSTIPGLVSTIISILRGEDPEAKKNEAEQKKKDEAEAVTQGDQTGARTDSTDSTDEAESEEEKKNTEQRQETEEEKKRREERYSAAMDEADEEERFGLKEAPQSPQNPGAANAGDAAAATDADTASVDATASNNANNKQSTATVGKPKTGSGGPIAKLLGGISSMLGGGLNILMGIGQMALAAVAQLSGFRILINLVKKVFTTAIKPINKLFKQLVAALKPVLKTLTSSLTTIVDSLVKVVGTLLDAIIPFLEPLMNIVCDIMDSLGGILTDALTGIVKLLTPLVNGVLKVLLPLIKAAHGVLEALFGGVMIGLGKIIYGIGSILSDLNVFDSDVLHQVALKLMQQGNDLAASGQDKFYSGNARMIDAFATPKTNTTTNTDNSQTTIDNSTTTIDNSQTTYNQSAAEKYGVDSTMTREAVASLHGEAVAAEIFGSGDSQASYGTFMNMNQHGCGPIALAENINRRNLRGVYGSGDIDPRSLTVSMYNAGLYNSNRGTSVADYLTASHALGYDMSVGGVNPRSLRQASPTNPVTLIGSGTGFGTRSGNNHYINVIGSDGAGSAYVSNPLTGRVSKASMSELTLNSKLGIYGSGDEKDEVSAVDKAKSDHLKDTVEENSAKDGVHYSNLEKGVGIGGSIALGLGTAALIPGIGWLVGGGAALVGILGSVFGKKESTPDERRIALERQIHSNNYNPDEIKVMRRILEDSINGKLSEDNVYYVGDTNDSADSTKLNTMDPNDLDFSAENIADKYGPSTTVSSILSGLKDLASNFLSMFTPEDTSTVEGKQKVLKRLRKEIGSNKYNQLRAYAFLQFLKEYPPTGLESLVPGSTGAGIYAARFKMHEYDYIMKYKDKVLNNIGNTPVLFTQADMEKLAYESGYGVAVFDGLNAQQISELICGTIDGLSEGTVDAALQAAETSSASYGNGSYATTGYNAQGHITTDGTMLSKYNAWPKYQNNKNVDAFISKAKAAGMTGGEIATIISTGIWEDAGKKIFGSKSITATTYDYNGQRAEGIMNWVSGSHATTIAGQLQEIHEKYFDPGTHERSKYVDNGYIQKDENAYKQATGRSGFTLNVNDKYYPLMNTDLIEGSEHFFRSALVPEKIHNAVGVAENVGTAVGVYNWMLDKGYFSPQITSGTAMGQAGFTGNKEDLMKSVAMIYEGYSKASPGVMSYLNTVWNKNITLRNGTTRKIRPDCSGIISAGIQELGYKLKGGDGYSGARSQQFAAPSTNNFILDQNGNPSPDWIVMPFSRDKLEPGDITARDGHVGMPIKNLTDDWPKGMDGGGSYNVGQDNIPKSAENAIKYLNGTPWQDLPWRSTMGPKWSKAGGATKIWRYIGGNPKINGINYSTDPRFSEVKTTSAINYSTDPRFSVKVVADHIGEDSDKNLKLFDANGNVIGSVLDAHGMGQGKDAWDKAHSDAYRMSSKWQKGDHDYWLYDYASNISGSGDTTSSLYIPPIDNKNFLTDALLNTDAAKQTNNYYIAKSSSDERREELNTLLNHTFNVRSESMEAILTEMLTELKKRGNSRTPVAVPSPTTTPSLFDDSIPPQIDRLMSGLN